MKNVVTPETARKLKEAGFKKSRAEKGETWYAFENRPYFIFEQTDQFVMGIYLDGDFQTAALPAKFVVEKYVFAPTATDILRELGGGIYLTAGTECFEVYDDWRDLENGRCQYMSLNPAHAVAMVWLQTRAK